jgi:hypothetical protein
MRRRILNVVAGVAARKKASSTPVGETAGRVFHSGILAISTGQIAKNREKPRQMRVCGAFSFDKPARPGAKWPKP